MPIIHKDIMCVTVKELIDCGISKRTIIDGVMRQRKKLVTCWPHHKEGRTVYIHYDGIKESYRLLIRNILLNGKEPTEWWESQGRLKEIEQRTKIHLSLSDELEISIADIKLPTGEYIPVKDMEKLREATMWIDLLCKCDNKKAIQRLGYQSATAFWEDICYYLRKKNIKLPYTYNRLRAKIREFKKEGVFSLIDKRLCTNRNACKVRTPEQEGVLSQLMSHYNGLDASQIAKAYNEIAHLKNWPELSSRTVSGYMKKNLLYLTAARKGQKEFRDKISMQVSRYAPTAPLSYWSIDGWKAELYYQKSFRDNAGRKVITYNNRLVIYIILDTYCDYPIGYAIGEKENIALVKEALKNAVDHTKELFNESLRPWQIQSDHAGMSTLGPVYKSLAHHFTPAKVGNAKAKRIERYNRTLIGNYCQYCMNFSGYGIKSPRQPNIDIKNLIKKDFPDKQGCIHQLEEIIRRERNSKRENMLEGWKSVPGNRHLKLSRENYLLLFGQKTERSIHLQGRGITPVINGKTYKYDSFDPMLREDLLTSWYLYYDEKDPETVLAVSANQKKRLLLERKYEQPMALTDRQQGDLEKLNQIKRFNVALEQHVSEVICDRIEKGKEVIESLNIHSLTDKTAAILLTDNRGQHKKYTYPEEHEKIRVKLTPAEKRNENKKVKENSSSEHAYFEYIRQSLDFEKYKNI